MKDLPTPKDPIELMGQAYERLLESAIEEAHELEEKTGPALHAIIDKSREKLSEWGELTEEQIERVAEYLKRDLLDAAEFIAENGEDFKRWLGFDAELLAERFKELFFKAADQTTVELFKLKEMAQQMDPVYRTGEMAGPGTLVCEQCGEKLQFKSVSTIPACPKCGGTRFHRKPDEQIPTED